jgi:hypothetical protein
MGHLVERACNERLVQIIEETQRRRFGCAETLPGRPDAAFEEFE